ncbi:MAG TPA: hypothetical protein VIL96_00365 [Gaiellaceae bacterium]|jgi:hypothetical protein
MKLSLIHEPDLEFADGGRHLDPRFGLLRYGPLDAGAAREPRFIEVGIIGTNQTIERLRDWLEACRNPLPGKETRLRNLFPAFPGFAGDTTFQAELVFDSAFDRVLNIRELRAVIRDSANTSRRNVCDVIVNELSVLLERHRPDVVMIALPLEVLERVEPGAAGDEPHEERRGRPTPPVDFHDLLKARAMRFRVPIQLVNPETYDPAAKRRQKRRADRARQLQDPTTRAWNLHIGLYYKSGACPWRLPRQEDDLATCFLGISFFRTLDGESLWTSVAQVFNQRGVGMIIRGGPAHQSKLDRQTHLSGAESERLVENAMTRYRQEHGHLPARVITHKTSTYTPEELSGFRSGLEKLGIDSFDLVSVRPADTKLFRMGNYPPQRGTLWTLEPDRHILYTRGSVPFYETYPGLYVPRPLEFRLHDPETTPVSLASEMLALTKLNWNTTQFDQGGPITIRAAREVGDILRYANPSEEIAPSYSAYM